MPVERTSGCTLFYQLSGTGPRLLLINGSGVTLESSTLLVGALSERFELLAYDHRGMGRSGEVTAPYAMSDCAADTLAVLDAVGWETAPVLGISFGGMVAQEVAIVAPARVEGLALLCTSSGGAGGSSYPLHELEDCTPEERVHRRRTLMDTRFNEEWLALHPADLRLVEMMEDRGPEPGPSGQLGARLQLDARRYHDTWDRLPAIDHPTFVGAGRFDGIAPLGNSEAMASRIPHGTLHVYEGGHAFLAQDPRAIGDVVEFLTAMPSAHAG